MRACAAGTKYTYGKIALTDRLHHPPRKACPPAFLQNNHITLKHMTVKNLLCSFAVLCIAFSTSAQDRLYHDQFPLGDVTLLDGPFLHAQETNLHTLLQYDCDRLLAPYRKEAGLEPRKEPYPNWDGLDGHVGGHYLSAMAMYAALGDEECRRRMDYMISELELVLLANNSREKEWCRNYIGGVPDSETIWDSFRKGDFTAYSRAWAPYYNIHKMFAGLRDSWLYGGSERGLKLFLHFCDWAVDITSGLSDAQMEQMMGNEQGGMDEVLADAYAVTGDAKYLVCARRYAHKMLLNPLERGEDPLDNLHANTQIPKVTGYQRIAELDGDEDMHRASEHFWKMVTEERSLALGGNSRREHFPTAENCIDYVNDIDGPESCNTYNMLKLTEALNRAHPQGRYGDFYERAVMNHILSTQHPEHGGYVYFTSARPRHYRNYSVPNMAMWCCVGSGMENHGKYGQFIWTRGKDDAGDVLYVNLFIASQLEWRDKKMQLTQETTYPYSERTKVYVSRGKGEFTLKVRKPEWCKNFSIKGIGFDAECFEEDGFVCVRRKWKKGEGVEISLPMEARIEQMPNVPQYVAIMYGPVLLGMKTGTEDLQALLADDSRFGQYASGRKLPLDQAPILHPKALSDLPSQLVPVEGKPLHFRLTTPMDNAIDGELQPFYEIHDSRYMMYWLTLGESDYQEYLNELERKEAAREELERRTVDKVQPGEQQPETDHLMETDLSEKGSTEGVFYRDARNGHYFSYLMATGGEDSLSLELTFWGQDEWRSAEFDIYIDDQLLCSVNNTKKYRTSQFKTESYPIPPSMLSGKTAVRVRFVAHPRRQVGQIYGVRLCKNVAGL